jgi:glycosyltransferase involved in cell wall biosynthesis
MKAPLYIIGFPGPLGGASTRLLHLALLLREDYDLTFIRAAGEGNDPDTLRFLARYGVKHALLDDLDRNLSGVAFVCCQTEYFASGLAREIKRRGLKVVWSNDMMWEFTGERAGAAAGLIDRVLFVSEFQRNHLRHLYGELPWAVVGNYICPDLFPFREKPAGPLNIGRLSRADARKYPEDFPVFYECISPPETRFWVMAWDEILGRKYRWHVFDQRWHLFKPNQVGAAEFLGHLDLFVYSLGPLFRESWGRAVVEAMLSGVPPLVPAGHFFDQLLVHEESGFICENADQYADYIRQLRADATLRARVARQARRHAETALCDRAAHRALWRAALTF